MQDRIAIIFGSTEGQTQKVAEFLAERFREHGADVAVIHGQNIPLDYSIGNSDAVVIGASIHMDEHQEYIVEFAKKHAAELNASQLSAFFSVNLTEALGEPEESDKYLASIEETGWKPTFSASFGGALKYTDYSWIKRQIMKRIAEERGGSTDTSTDFEYTDWKAVLEFADKVFEEVVARR